MGEKKPDKDQGDQHERFRRAIQEMIDAGELNPTDADEAFNALIGQVGQQPEPNNPD